MMLAQMQQLGLMPSLSRSRVSNDNPSFEAAFRTPRYVPFWPDKPFASLEAARVGVAHFVAWYNNDERRHSALDYLTPSERHEGRGDGILENRRTVHERARRVKPARWSRGVSRWRADAEVSLDRPRKGRRKENLVVALA